MRRSRVFLAVSIPILVIILTVSASEVVWISSILPIFTGQQDPIMDADLAQRIAVDKKMRNTATEQPPTPGDYLSGEVGLPEDQWEGETDQTPSNEEHNEEEHNEEGLGGLDAIDVGCIPSGNISCPLDDEDCDKEDPDTGECICKNVDPDTGECMKTWQWSNPTNGDGGSCIGSLSDCKRWIEEDHGEDAVITGYTGDDGHFVPCPDYSC